jgi:hypothetical protein
LILAAGRGTLGKIGNNLNHRARVANARGQIRQVQSLEQALKELLDAVRVLA